MCPDSAVFSWGFFFINQVHRGGLISPTNQKPDPQRDAAVNKLQPHHSSTPDPLGSLGNLHRRTHVLQNDRSSYFVRTKAGALCFRQGTEVAPPKDETLKVRPSGIPVLGHRRILQKPDESKTPVKSVEESGAARGKPKRGKRLVKCICRPGLARSLLRSAHYGLPL